MISLIFESSFLFLFSTFTYIFNLNTDYFINHVILINFYVTLLSNTIISNNLRHYVNYMEIIKNINYITIPINLIFVYLSNLEYNLKLLMFALNLIFFQKKYNNLNFNLNKFMFVQNLIVSLAINVYLYHQNMYISCLLYSILFFATCFIDILYFYMYNIKCTVVSKKTDFLKEYMILELYSQELNVNNNDYDTLIIKYNQTYIKGSIFDIIDKNRILVLTKNDNESLSIYNHINILHPLYLFEKNQKNKLLLLQRKFLLSNNFAIVKKINVYCKNDICTIIKYILFYLVARNNPFIKKINIFFTIKDLHEFIKYIELFKYVHRKLAESNRHSLLEYNIKVENKYYTEQLTTIINTMSDEKYSDVKMLKCEKKIYDTPKSIDLEYINYIKFVKNYKEFYNIELDYNNDLISLNVPLKFNLKSLSVTKSKIKKYIFEPVYKTTIEKDIIV